MVPVELLNYPLQQLAKLSISTVDRKGARDHSRNLLILTSIIHSNGNQVFYFFQIWIAS